MNRTEKAEVIEFMKEKFGKATAAFASEYRGMTVEAMGELRSKVRKGNGEVHVVKNRLARIAMKGSAMEHIGDQIKGPIVLALSFKDPVPVAKALLESVSETSPFQVKLGSLSGRVLQGKEIVALSKLPDRNTLLAMMVGTLQAPIQNLAGVLSALPRNLAYALQAVKEKKN